jgi:two-component system, LytTR family, response regulator
MNIRVLLIDDEPLARAGIAARLAQYPDMALVGECSTGEEALLSIPQVSPDLIFADIEMPGISGLDLLRGMPKDGARCVVFVTAHEEYALEAFNVEALDYLLKPFDEARFAACIERVRRMLSLHRQEAHWERLHGLLKTPEHREGGETIKRFPVRRGNEFIFVPVRDVDWIEGLGDYAGLHVGDKAHLLREPLHSLEARLDRTQFVRIHRSTIVQVERIARLEPATNRDAVVLLRGGNSLRVSRTYRSRLEEVIYSL